MFKQKTPMNNLFRNTTNTIDSNVKHDKISETVKASYKKKFLVLQFIIYFFYEN